MVRHGAEGGGDTCESTRGSTRGSVRDAIAEWKAGVRGLTPAGLSRASTARSSSRQHTRVATPASSAEVRPVGIGPVPVRWRPLPKNMLQRTEVRSALPPPMLTPPAHCPHATSAH